MVRQRVSDSAFDIHVDPSCLSTPMDEDVPTSKEETPKAAEASPVGADSNPDPEDRVDEAADMSVEKMLQDTVDELQSQQDKAAAASTTEQEDPAQDEAPGDSVLSTETPGEGTEVDSESRRSSTPHRRISGRTDALIQAAARAVVDQIERQRQEDAEPYLRDSVMSSAINDRSYTDASDASFITDKDRMPGHEGHDGHGQDSRRESVVSESQAIVDQRRDSLASESQASPGQRRDSETPSRGVSLAAADERRGSATPSHARNDSEDHDRGADSSSHHDADSEVFSDRSHSARSSLGSFEDHRGSVRGDDSDRDAKSRSSRISDFSQYEREEFVPTIRGNPRPPFRTPSDVRALQMASPPTSVFGGSPRSSKRHHLPTISRLGSPTPSIQYSPKGRTTPSRLKPRKATPPLVLLHATILPLRWPWGDVLEDAPSDALTPKAKTLRETWRFLHDRLGDTVCERGVLLPHPQGDYEILEERLLDALELPLRRRARILECGHYVGPANELTLTEDLDSDAEDADLGSRPYSRQSSAMMSPARSVLGLSGGPQTHWCGTCHHDIKFESLGPGKVFRVKVYASNGLMKAGAWAACWKEMERVDVEIEPIIDGADLQDELENLATRQHEAAERAAEEEDAAQAAAELDESIIEEDTYVGDHQLPPPSSPPAVEGVAAASPSPGSSISRHDQVEERRLRDEARMREIYGEDEPAVPEDASPQPSDSVPLPSAESYNDHHASPVSPSEEARARRDARRSSRTRASSALQNATLPELLLEAVRVMLQDRKNVALVLLSCLVLFLAVKPAQRDEVHLGEWDQAYIHRDVEAAIPKAPVVQVDVSPEGKTVGIMVSEAQAAVSEAAMEQNPCEMPGSAAVEKSTVAGEPAVQEKQETVPKKDGVMEQEQTARTIKETVTSREVVRVVETVTETETVKAYATATIVEAVRPSVEDVETPESGLPAEDNASVEDNVSETIQSVVQEPEEQKIHEPDDVNPSTPDAQALGSHDEPEQIVPAPEREL